MNKKAYSKIPVFVPKPPLVDRDGGCSYCDNSGTRIHIAEVWFYYGIGSLEGPCDNCRPRAFMLGVTNFIISKGFGEDDAKIIIRNYLRDRMP